MLTSFFHDIIETCLETSHLPWGLRGVRVSHQSVCNAWMVHSRLPNLYRQDIYHRHASLHHQRGCPRFGFSQATNNMSEEALRFPTLCSAFDSTHVGKDRLMCTVGCTEYLDFSFAFSLICCVHTLLRLCEMYIQNLSPARRRGSTILAELGE